MRRKKTVELLEKCIPVIFLMAMLLLDVWFLVCRGAAYIDADMAADVVYADFLNKQGTIISDSWWHSTQLKLGEVLNLIQIGLLIFPHNWVMGRAVGVILINIMAVISYYFCSKVLGNKKSQSLLFAAFMVSPFGYFFFEFSVFGGFYTATLIYSLLAIMLVILDVKNIKRGIKNKWKIYLPLSMIGILLGISGLRYAIFPIIPFILTAAFFVFDTAHNRKEKLSDFTCAEMKVCISIGMLTVTYVLGYVFNVAVLAKRYTYEQFGEMTWGPLSFDALVSGVFEFLSLFGYQYDEIMMMWTQQKAPISVFSLQGIASSFGILIAGFLVFSIIRLIYRYKELSFYNRFIVVLFVTSVAVSAVLFKMTRGFDAEAQYWIPLIGLSFLIMQAEINTEKLSLEYTKEVILLILVCSISICSIASVKQYEKAPTHANPQLVNIARLLKDSGYKQGYATFWYAPAITFLTDGDVEMWGIYEFTNLASTQPWLQKMSHSELPSDARTCAVIGPIDGINHDEYFPYMDQAVGTPVEVYHDEDGFIVVEYNK